MRGYVVGTNYYWYDKPPCEACKRPHPAIHIGKSSGGWYFLLHVDLHQGINSLDVWARLFTRPGSYIKTEYDDLVSVAEMMRTITERSWHGSFDWSEEKLRANHAVKADHGLVRCELDNNHCIGHGEGTWDLITGEFS